MPGDVIIAVDGKLVKRANDLASALDNKKIGNRVTLRIIRSDKKVRCQRWKVLTLCALTA